MSGISTGGRLLTSCPFTNVAEELKLRVTNLTGGQRWEQISDSKPLVPDHSILWCYLTFDIYSYEIGFIRKILFLVFTKLTFLILLNDGP